MAGSVISGRGFSAGCPFRAFFLYAGTSEATSTDRYGSVTTSTDRYGSAYPCTVSGQSHATCVVPFLALSPWFPRNVSTYTGGVSPPNYCTKLVYLHQQPCPC